MINRYMASTETKATAKEASVEERLRALYDLQKVSTEIDKIRTLRGELPLEVQDLEDEIAGLETRIANFDDEIDKLNADIANKKHEIKDAEAAIKKYEEQQNTVRNNREYDAISKEIEYQNLEKQLCEKRIREYTAELERKKQLSEDAKVRIAERKSDLQVKRSELDSIVADTKQDEDRLLAEAAKISEGINERELASFNRIRGNARNGLAVVTVSRGACGGCFNKIPPQRQLDIRLRKKLIVCEYCGRILVDNDIDTPMADLEAVREASK